jgi:hypothetical protein
VDRPEAVHAGYTQAGVEEKGELTNVIAAQFSMYAILSLLQPENASSLINVTLLGILTDAREVH